MKEIWRELTKECKTAGNEFIRAQKLLTLIQARDRGYKSSDANVDTQSWTYCQCAGCSPDHMALEIRRDRGMNECIEPVSSIMHICNAEL